MNRHLATAVVVIGAFVTIASAAGAQTCVGFAPFANGPARISGDFSIADHATSYGAAAVFGTTQPGLFGGGSISGTRLDGTNETAKNLGLSGGFSIPLISLPGTELCPVADFVHTWGPDLGDIHSTANSIALGGSIGHPFAASPTLTLIPFAELRWVHVNGHLESPLGEADGSDNFGSLTIGTGIMFTKTVTLRPALLFPIAEDNASTVLLVSIAFSLGK